MPFIFKLLGHQTRDSGHSCSVSPRGLLGELHAHRHGPFMHLSLRRRKKNQVYLTGLHLWAYTLMQTFPDLWLSRVVYQKQPDVSLLRRSVFLMCSGGSRRGETTRWPVMLTSWLLWRRASLCLTWPSWSMWTPTCAASYLERSADHTVLQGFPPLPRRSIWLHPTCF